MLSRDALIEHLAARLRREAVFRAVALGGSDATGRADALSDVDVILVVEPGRVEEAVTTFDAALAELSPIRVRLRLPMPTWHGFHQAFYQLADAAEHTMVDWVIVEKGQAGWDTWLEVERHGAHRILFDHDGVIVPAHLDRAALGPLLERRVQELRARFALFRHLPAKLVRRGAPGEGGRPIDAVAFYQSLVLRPLVDLLRIVHCPERHDFGFRYLRDDLPRETYEALVPLCYPPSPDALPGLVDRAATMFATALAAWDARVAGERDR